jgi:hypothetical protein
MQPSINLSNEVSALAYNYEAYQAKIADLDRASIDSHNARYPQGHKYYLHTSIHPCPFEGDLQTAKVVFLLANPHYQQNESTPLDHQRIDGWGLWGLSSRLPSMHSWWRPRLRHFIGNAEVEEEWRLLSHKVASFQAIAWASENFHECNSLPSKHLLALTLARLAQSRSDVLFVVMRQRAYWLNVLKGTGAKVVLAKNPRCSFISRGNLQSPNDWRLIVDALT